MKKRVLTLSLSLLACLCCCFSGFGSVNAYALNATYPQYNLDVLEVYSTTLNKSFTRGDDGVFSVDVSSAINITDGLTIRLWADDDNTDNSMNFPIMPDIYDYYVYASFAQRTDGGTFKPNSIVISNGRGTSEYPTYLTDVQYYDIQFLGNDAYYGINKSVFVGKFNLNSDKSNYYLGGIKFKGDAGTVKDVIYFEFSIFVVPKADAEAAASIAAAIKSQTNTLGGKLDKIDGSVDQAADDIQQSIEDQYQMEDEEDFGFSDIQQQYEEKMGVLTFGTETTIQMLELFSPSNAGEAYIRVPGWSMDVQGETYQIWGEYVFYFDSIEENFPFLVTTMRTFTVAMFYVAIVGYITKVYERNFLAK